MDVLHSTSAPKTSMTKTIQVFTLLDLYGSEPWSSHQLLCRAVHNSSFWQPSVPLKQALLYHIICQLSKSHPYFLLDSQSSLDTFEEEEWLSPGGRPPASQDVKIHKTKVDISSSGCNTTWWGCDKDPPDEAGLAATSAKNVFQGYPIWPHMRAKNHIWRIWVNLAYLGADLAAPKIFQNTFETSWPCLWASLA